MEKESIYKNLNLINKELIFINSLGYDIHRSKITFFNKRNKISLGGYSFLSKYKFIAHSDGDLIIHAIIDSLSNLIFKKDIGELFPDKDPKYKNIVSKKLLNIFLKQIEEEIIKRNIYIKFVSLDILLVSDIIKISPIKENIISSLKEFFPDTIISIKGKTLEKVYKKNTNICYVLSTILIDKSFYNSLT